MCCGRSGPSTGCPVSDPSALSPQPLDTESQEEIWKSQPPPRPPDHSQASSGPSAGSEADPIGEGLSGDLGSLELNGAPTPGQSTVRMTWEDPLSSF